MAKKKSSGANLGVSLLIKYFLIGIAWAGRFFVECSKNLKFIYKKFLEYNIQFDNWCVLKNGKKLDPISKFFLIFICSVVVIPITIFWSFLRSF